MKKILPLATWNRREHFEFFKRFEEPFFGVCVELDCNSAYTFCKKNDYSFFLFYLHKCLLAAQAVECFRYRIEGDEVVIYDAIHAAATIMRDDGTFNFSHINYIPDFESFQANGLRIISEVQKSKGLDVYSSGNDVIHFSVLPWLRFTSMSHARHFGIANSCPKMTFGKMNPDGNRRMPFSVHVHHALVDGYHLGQFVELFQDLLQAKTI